MSELVRYDAMCRAIDAAYAVDEVKAIHDKAAMLQAAARVANNTEAENRAYQIRMRAARKAGELSKKIEKGHGNRHSRTPENTELKGKILNDAGISTQQASEWERLNDVPDDEFESALATRSVGDLTKKNSRHRNHDMDGCDAPDEDAGVEERWSYNFENMAELSIELPKHWERTFNGWDKVKITRDQVNLAKHAASTWNAIAKTLEGMFHDECNVGHLS